MRFRILGPVRVWQGTTDVKLGPPKQRALLALLLAHAGRPVPLHGIVDALWHEHPPATAVNVIHRHVAALRRLLEPGLPSGTASRRLVRDSGGYRIDVAPDELDLLCFRTLRRDARRSARQGDRTKAVELLVEALDLWRGPAGSGIPPEVRALPVFTAVDDEHVAAVKEAAGYIPDAGAVLTEHILAALRQAASQHPLDESLQARLIEVLAAAGRQAEALETYQVVRARITDEIGLDPGPELREAQLTALNRPRRPHAQASAEPGPDPAAATGAPSPAQLPRDLGAFTGRASELDPAEEIFELNRGLAQKDGGTLDSPADRLYPGWILRLPKDASGPGVQLARDTGGQSNTGGQSSASASPASGSTAPPGTDDEQSTMLTIPLAAAIAILGAILLALVTAGIVGRRKVRAGYTAVRRGLHRLGEPARRRRRLAHRQATSRWFDADADSVRRAYGALGEFAATDREPERPVHALSVDEGGVTVWLSASDTAGAPWTSIDGTRWRRPAAAPGPQFPGVDGMASPAVPTPACLVRAGTNAEGRPVFVDLSRLDGVLSVTGEKAVARDVVQNLLAEIARTRPGTPVTVLRGTADAPPLAVPPGLRQSPQVTLQAMTAPVPAQGTVRAAASRRPLKGLVVVAGTPGSREAAELTALCGPGGAGWTALVYGEARDAHWRWYTDGDGHVDIPVLDLRLTVPA
ncbi:BTAD domain-containing putative transcriptional regulator [Streptomyces sp. NPDC059629]|uniref:BTAD domain-containing putative transcriptional regulator n=1 Tax=Streptomyces sp. NPDC059629 TaxID=3346889 RepID=UPI00367738BD